MEKLKIGDYVGWKSQNLNNTCAMCGKAVGENPYYVQLSIWGEILSPCDEEESQGFWEIGSSCANKFDPSVLVRF